MTQPEKTLDAITDEVVDAAYKLHQGIHRIVNDFLPSASPRLRVNLLPEQPPT